MLVFFGGGHRTIIARYAAKWGIAWMCLSETKYRGGGIAPFWGSANLPEKVSRDMGYRSDSIAISRDMGPLSCGDGAPRLQISVSCRGRTRPDSKVLC